MIHITTIGIRAMTSKTTTMKFEVEKFDENNNFRLCKMQVTILLMKGHSQGHAWC